MTMDHIISRVTSKSPRKVQRDKGTNSLKSKRHEIVDKTDIFLAIILSNPLP